MTAGMTNRKLHDSSIEDIYYIQVMSEPASSMLAEPALHF